MIVEWRDGRALADKNALAELYQVSARTVRRYCQPVSYHDATGAALYDALHAGDALAHVRPRPKPTTLDTVDGTVYRAGYGGIRSADHQP